MNQTLNFRIPELEHETEGLGDLDVEVEVTLKQDSISAFGTHGALEDIPCGTVEIRHVSILHKYAGRMIEMSPLTKEEHPDLMEYIADQINTRVEALDWEMTWN